MKRYRCWLCKHECEIYTKEEMEPKLCVVSGEPVEWSKLFDMSQKQTRCQLGDEAFKREYRKNFEFICGGCGSKKEKIKGLFKNRKKKVLRLCVTCAQYAELNGYKEV